MNWVDSRGEDGRREGGGERLGEGRGAAGEGEDGRSTKVPATVFTTSYVAGGLL